MSISTGHVDVAISGCSCTDDELTMVPGLTIKGTLTRDSKGLKGLNIDD